jgi:PleD family two-component response regulator
MEQPQVDIGNVRPLRPLRVLVAARDARFGRVAGFLLARRGFDVEILHRPSQVLDAVSRTGSDVVIVDASDSFSETARSVGTLEALHPHLTVIVVADHPAEADGATFRVLPKWTSLETLVLNLQATHLGLARA